MIRIAAWDGDVVGDVRVLDVTMVERASVVRCGLMDDLPEAELSEFMRHLRIGWASRL